MMRTGLIPISFIHPSDSCPFQFEGFKSHKPLQISGTAENGKREGEGRETKDPM